MVGIYHEPTVKVEVEIEEPDLSVTRETIECLKKEGINVSCYYNQLLVKLQKWGHEACLATAFWYK